MARERNSMRVRERDGERNSNMKEEVGRERARTARTHGLIRDNASLHITTFFDSFRYSIPGSADRINSDQTAWCVSHHPEKKKKNFSLPLSLS
jgi:hypothetical protein